jgi:hypothetical protein
MTLGILGLIEGQLNCPGPEAAERCKLGQPQLGWRLHLETTVGGPPRCPVAPQT